MAGQVKRQARAGQAGIAVWSLAMVLFACDRNESVHMNFTEIQLTDAAQGHTIHHTQVFSRDGEWIVYDTRNDDTKIGSTGRIEMVHVETGEVRTLYVVPNQTEHGPGVGAVTFSPAEDRVIFIHGIRNADASRPYGMTRRTGVAIDIKRPDSPIFMDARDIMPPFTAGALRGGTHAHSWSGDGQWISFTYNDYVMEQMALADTAVQDLRTVGVMVPGWVFVADDDSLENHSGERFSVVVATVTENPEPGSDEIDKAFDECWIGTDGYQKADGSRMRRAIAFQGNVRNIAGQTITEVFVADLPSDLAIAAAGKPLEGTSHTRPSVPAGVVQRRLTFTEKGIGGPRHWLRTTPDGSLVLYLAEDGEGIVQLFSVPVNGGASVQLTHHAFGVEAPFNIHPGGDLIVYVADNSLFITSVSQGTVWRATRRFDDADKPVGAPVWSPDGEKIVYNRYVGEGSSRFLQLFLLRK